MLFYKIMENLQRCESDDEQLGQLKSNAIDGALNISTIYK
jgi:hypothetical protein